ncbi:alpha/beta hydrolase [Paralimibaculum aggregatum]|uniref:Alpha/beta hydrolase n=1 Tax=Paralimibaculum aggregatum TaxID=3036245 RepID=A0ABQ6LHM3_9RHOB|nr:alpha/beta hydrolase [Limibaculum sp. NKW23]GMG81142.1 alpha/beta hydrolase [Limibaculum sp. NKW23]
MSGHADGGAIDWETAYDNRAAVPGAGDLPEVWTAAAQRFVAETGIAPEAVAYGPGARNRVHLLRPAGEAAGLAVFIHGGYWMRNGPEMFHHLAAGALARGWAVAMPGYTLCPDASIAGIGREVAAAVERAAERVPGPIRLSGHSAGGHLAARLACAGMLPEGTAERVAGVLSISGLHDLRPLMRTPMNPVLQLDLAMARAESPALREPLPGVPVTAWVGAAELPALRAQARLIAGIWALQGADVCHVEDAGHDHFSVIEALADPESPITRAWLGV